MEVDDATDAAVRFAHNVGSDPAAACALLAPKTLSELEGSAGPCPESLPEQHLPPSSGARHAEVYGKDAIVHLQGDTVFLARFQTGWRVTAAGCVPNGDQPYDCVVKGG